MKKQELQSIIRECIQTVLAENAKDPTREEMLKFLQKEFGPVDAGYIDDAEVAMYWFANHYHGGQWSNLYSVLSTSPFRPGPISRGPEPGSMEDDMYKALEAKYGGMEHQHGTDVHDGEDPHRNDEPHHPGESEEWDALQESGKDKVLKYLDNSYYILSPRQAKEFSVDGKLPRSGYEKKADLSKLQGYQVDFRGQIRPLKISPNTSGWIHLTPVGNEQVWAIRLYDRGFIQQGIKENDAVVDPEGMAAPESAAKQRLQGILDKSKLDDSQKEILYLRFIEDYNYHELAQLYSQRTGKKITKEKIRQMEARALRLLRSLTATNPSLGLSEDGAGGVYPPTTLIMNRMGHIHMWKGDLEDPLTQVKQTGKYNWTINGKESDVYVQFNTDVQEILNSLTPDERKELEKGYTVVTTNLSDEYFGRDSMNEDGTGGVGAPGAPGTGAGNVTANVDPIRVPFGGGRKHPKDVPAHRTNEAMEEEDPLYVEFVRERPGEEPFMMNGQKFQYVTAKYPNGKEDIGVYAFAGDVVYSYNVFRQRMGIQEEEQPEMYDAETDQFAPGPRQRPEDWTQGTETTPVPKLKELLRHKS